MDRIGSFVSQIGYEVTCCINELSADVQDQINELSADVQYQIVEFNQEIQNLRTEFGNNIGEFRNGFTQLEGELDQIVRSDYTPRIQNAVSKIFKAIPEAAILSFAILGDFPVVATLGVVRLTMAVLPMIQNFVVEGDQQSTDAALGQVSDNMKDLIKKCHVGLAMASAVAAVSLAVFGWLDPSLTLADIIARTAFWAIISHASLLTSDIDDAPEQPNNYYGGRC